MALRRCNILRGFTVVVSEMQNQDLINNLKAFNAISPNQEWADLARMNLVATIGATPVVEKSVFSFDLSQFSAFATGMRYAAVGAFSFIMAMGGVVAASQNSLPGSALYPVKLASESVQGAVRFGAQEEKNLSTQIAKRRIAEVSQLASSKLSTEEAASVQAQLDEYNQLIVEVSVAENQEEALQKVEEVEAKAVALGSALGSATDAEGFATGLKAAVEARMVACTNESVAASVEAALASGTTEGLVEANELSLRCEEVPAEEVVEPTPAVEEPIVETPVQEETGV